MENFRTGHLEYSQKIMRKLYLLEKPNAKRKMLISIELAVLDQKDDQNLKLLDRILMLFESGQHEWYLLEDLNEIMKLFWPCQLSPRHQSMLADTVTKSFVRTANISKKERELRGITQIEVKGVNCLADMMS